MGTLSAELPQSRKRVQKEVLRVWDAGTFSKVLSKREFKREVERKREECDQVGMGDRERWSPRSEL